MEKDAQDGLIFDPKRLAVDSLRGGFYQLWQSLLTWTSLKPNEALYLEGAEDFDVLGPDYAVTNQVKDIKQSVTLQSKEILEAISNFWQHRKSNPQYAIQYRFLTTAERGLERSRPFGKVKGLDHWDTCRRPDASLDSLRSFLLRIDSLPTELHEFVKSSSDEQLRENLIDRIEWLTGLKEYEHIKEQVNNWAIKYGYEVHSLSSRDSLKVVAVLFQYVSEIVIKKEDRRLLFADLIHLFDKTSTVPVSKRDFDLLNLIKKTEISTLTQLAGVDVSSYASESFKIQSNLAFPILRPSEKWSERPQIISDLQSRIENQPILVLKGLTGMGKSTLASFLALSTKGKWQRIDFRGSDSNVIKASLNYLSIQRRVNGQTTDYIVDDLNFDKDVAVYENALLAFLDTVRAQGGRVIITTQGDLPFRIAAYLGVTKEGIYPVPPFDEEEIKSLLSNYGCIPPKLVDTWSRIISLKTLGHPILVHAYIRKLESEAWPNPKVEDVFNNKDFHKIRREARNWFPSQEAQLLAYRLSLVTGPFKREQALLIASHEPKIANAGNAFDQLLGPWIEQINEEYYRLSHLLAGTANEVFTPEEIRKLHEAIAWAFYYHRNISPIELHGILLHGLLAGSRGAMITAQVIISRIPHQHWPEFSSRLQWLSFYGWETGKNLFPSDPFISLTLRKIQFDIAASSENKELAEKVSEQWDQELDRFDKNAYGGSKPFLEAIFIWDIIHRRDVPIPVNRIIKLVIRALVIQRGKLIKDQENSRFEDLFGSEISAWANPKSYLLSAINRCRSTLDFLLFVSELQKQGYEESKEVWQEFKDNYYLASQLLDNMWLIESQKPNPTWELLIKFYDNWIELGIDRQATAFAASAIRAKAIIQAEYLKDTASASKTIQTGLERLGFSNPVLRCYLATIHFIDKNYEEANKIWTELIPEFTVTRHSSFVFPIGDAERCASYLGKWDLSFQFAQLGEAVARRGYEDKELPDLTIAVGFLADSAYLLWKGNNRGEAVSFFAKALDQLESLPDPQTNTSAYALNIRLSYVITWIRQFLDDKSVQPKPDVALFTRLENQEQLRIHPIPPIAYSWVNLAWAEYHLQSGKEVFQRLVSEDNKSDLPIVHIAVSELDLRHSLRVSPSPDLILKLEHYIGKLDEYSRTRNNDAFANQETKETRVDTTGVSAKEKQHLFTSLILITVLRYVDKGEITLPLLEQWQSSIKQQSTTVEGLSGLLDGAQRCLGSTPYDLVVILRDSSQSYELRLIAAMFLSSTHSQTASEDVDPEVQFYANTILTLSRGVFGIWHQEAGEVINRLVSEGWMSVASNQRFALRQPSLTAPEIIQVCEDKNLRGFAKAAQVLLAAEKAVRTNLDIEAKSQLIELSKV